MSILKNELEQILKNSFPLGQVTVTDLAGDNDHYQIEITCISFQNISRVKQHQKVYAALKGHEIHALAIKTNCT